MPTSAEFSTFIHDVHGWDEPFPWQRALVDRIVAERRWPDTIDVPTGLGKTLLIDVALYLSAVDPPLSRRRIFFVVDRRLVVDEAYDHARAIQRVLANPRRGSVAEAVANALRQPGDPEDVLEVTRMRGGVTWDARWVERPDRHAVVTGTVDQVGSRLLFRGYGVTEQARSIDAALVGTDSLIVVDEAHLAQPFLDTTSTLAHFNDDPPIVVRMSATTRLEDAHAHTITEDDENHPVAGQRLRAPKRLRLVEVPKGARSATAMPNTMADLALALVGPGRVVGVVANTVARARAVFERVEGAQVDAVLLTGRSRLVDRDYLLSEHYDRLRVGRSRSGKPLVVVATQTIEVGANIDLDALVTESAPFDALAQRLGRLNRLGEVTELSAPALVVHDGSVGDDDPVYGETRLATWQWLCSRPGADPIRHTKQLQPADLPNGLDASPAALRELRAELPATLRPDQPYVPVMTESTLDAWVRTSPSPHPDPPVGPYLHGLAEPRPMARIVWRAGLYGRDPEQWRVDVDRIPPAGDEQIEVPLAAARRWLESGTTDPALSDLDRPAEWMPRTDAASPRAYRVRDKDGRPQALRVHGRGDVEVTTSDRLVPDDLIVVPAEYGGCDRYGWNPGSDAPAVDVADLAHRRKRPILRIGPYLRTVVSHFHPRSVVVDSPALAELVDPAQDGPEAARTPEFGRAALDDLAKAVREDNRDCRLARNLDALLAAGAQASPWDGELWRALLTSPGTGFAEDRSATGSSVIGRRTPLKAHQENVAARARRFAENLRLPEAQANCVELAARWHDEGKRDPRFQVMLWGGDHVQAEVATELLAKSGTDPGDRAARHRAQRQAGYPFRMRHEALSARIAELRLAAKSCADPDLVIHLVTSHHGYGRPLLPPVADLEPVKVSVAGQVLSTEHTVDWSSPARFVRLNQRYGPWRLALLEAVVRLADMWCSARGE